MSKDNVGAGKAAVPLEMIYRPVSELKPAKRNARTHGERQIRHLMDSIDRHGFNAPVVLDADGRIVAGHARTEAARRLGLTEVPTICITHLSEAELRAYAIADNRIAELAGWDYAVLRAELEDLEVELETDLEITGFNTGELETILDDLAEDEDDPLDQLPVIDEALGFGVEAGDLWRLGRHRLYCGSALDDISYQRLMGSERARMVFADPPFNVPVQGHVGGLGKVQHAEFAMGVGEFSPPEFTSFLATTFGHQVRYSIDGSLHFQCMDWRHIVEMMEAGESAYTELKNLCVWVKENGGMGSLYRSRHELVFVWKSGNAPHLNTIELGRNGRYRTNVWEYRGATKTGKKAELAMHPTVKPVAMIMDAIKDTSKRGEIVLDSFGGSGSTLIAAEKAGRMARLIELEPRYCAVTIARWQVLTGKEAVLDSTGETWAEMRARRLAEPVTADPLEETRHG